MPRRICPGKASRGLVVSLTRRVDGPAVAGGRPGVCPTNVSGVCPTNVSDAAAGKGDWMYEKANGLEYKSFLGALHEQILFDWYLEVGCRTGESFAPVRSKTIAIDPFFRANINVIGRKPALHVFQTTSDEFFSTDFLARNGIQLSLSFLDGMHLFEYLLRDLIKVEAASGPGAVILMHDCAPRNLRMTTRDLTAIRGAWTGDVWKLVPILKTYRDDLTLTMLDCHPTGLL